MTTQTAAEAADTRRGCPIHGLLSVDADGVGPLQRLAVFGYGLVAYSLFLISFVYAIGFVTGWFVPKHINSGTPAQLWLALPVNGALLALFAVQHAVMARPRVQALHHEVHPSRGRAEHVRHRG